MISHENDFSYCEDEVDDKMKKRETLAEKKICCDQMSIHPNLTSNSLKNKEIKNYYRHEELVLVFFLITTPIFSMCVECLGMYLRLLTIFLCKIV